MDQIEEAADQRDWLRVRELSIDVLLADATNADAQDFLALAERAPSNSALFWVKVVGSEFTWLRTPSWTGRWPSP